jgi:hypothetical protein
MALGWSEAVMFLFSALPRQITSAVNASTCGCVHQQNSYLASAIPAHRADEGQTAPAALSLRVTGSGAACAAPQRFRPAASLPLP